MKYFYNVIKVRLRNKYSRNIWAILTICRVGQPHDIFYLWRPYLPDPDDDMVLELAVRAHCPYIVTYNMQDFKAIDVFGITAVTAKEFLTILEESL